MGINLLPQEVFEEITSHLNLSDILSCCLVSVSWRNTINNNRIWSRLCKKKFDIKNDFCKLITNQNNVEPSFVIPVNNFYSLTDVCQWRLRFMQEVHISRNWRNGRYVSELITQVNGEILESEGNMIIVPDNGSRSFTPWSIEDEVTIKNSVQYCLRNMLASFFKLCDDKVVIVQSTLLQVFSRTADNEFVLSHRMLFNKPYEESNNIPRMPDITEWYNDNIGLYPCDITICCDHDGKYFVGVISEGDLNKAILHIWDISTGIKFKDQSLPEIHFSVIDIRFTLHNSNVIFFLKIKIDNKNCTNVFCFNLNTLKYTSMFIHIAHDLPVVLVRDPYLLTTDTTVHNIYLWKIIDGELLYRIGYEYYLNPMTIQFASSFLLTSARYPDPDVVKVFNTKTLKTVCEIKTGFPVINIMLIRSELMLIKGSREFGVWDITTGTKVCTLGDEIRFCRHIIWTNNNCSKIVLETERNYVYLFQFW